MTGRTARLSRLVTALVVASGCLLLGVRAGAAAPPVPTWTGGEPLPKAPGLGLKRNQDAEPGMGVAPDGQLWVSSNVPRYAADDPRAFERISGADIWTSTDNGRTFRWVADPFRSAKKTAGLAGSDTDIAVAPVKNAQGFYNVYAASLWIGASTLAWSTDGGKTWQRFNLGGVPAQDRPWVAASGACVVYLAYHQVPTLTPVANKYNVCNVADTSTGIVLDPVDSTLISLSTFPGLTNYFGKWAVDNSTSQYAGNIYLPMTVCTAEELLDVPVNLEASLEEPCPKNTEQVVAVSADQGVTWHAYHVATSPNGYFIIWPNTVAVDSKGVVYFTWTDNLHSYINVSRDGGKQWSATKRLNTPPSSSAVYPQVAADRPGVVDVAWYGSAKAGDANDPETFGPPGKATSTPWYVFHARSFDGGRTFVRSRATGVIHHGWVCTQGTACPTDGSRNLLDNFGIAVSPKTGFATIAYTSDQPDGTAGHSFSGFTTMTSSPSPGGRASPGGTTAKPGLAATGGLPLAGVACLAVLAALLLRGRRRHRSRLTSAR